MIYGVIRLHSTTTCRQLGNDMTYDTEKKNPTSHDVADTSAVSGRRVGKTRHHVIKTNCGRHLTRRHFQLSRGTMAAAIVHRVLLIDMLCLVLDLCVGMVLTYRRSTLLLDNLVYSHFLILVAWRRLFLHGDSKSFLHMMRSI